LTTWRCVLSAELTKTHFFILFFFGDFAHWVDTSSSYGVERYFQI